jgi:hypothetical protein
MTKIFFISVSPPQFAASTTQQIPGERVSPGHLPADCPKVAQRQDTRRPLFAAIHGRSGVTGNTHKESISFAQAAAALVANHGLVASHGI